MKLNSLSSVSQSSRLTFTYSAGLCFRISPLHRLWKFWYEDKDWPEFQWPKLIWMRSFLLKNCSLVDLRYRIQFFQVCPKIMYIMAITIHWPKHQKPIFSIFISKNLATVVNLLLTKTTNTHSHLLFVCLCVYIKILFSFNVWSIIFQIPTSTSSESSVPNLLTGCRLEGDTKKNRRKKNKTHHRPSNNSHIISLKDNFTSVCVCVCVHVLMCTCKTVHVYWYL